MGRNILRICEGCGREYAATRTNQRFHSPACKAQWHRDVIAPLPEPLETALHTAWSLVSVRSPKADEALRAAYALIGARLGLASVNPTSTPARPEPELVSVNAPAPAFVSLDVDDQAGELPAVDVHQAGELAATPAPEPTFVLVPSVSLDVDDLRTRLQRVLSGEDPPHQKTIAETIETSPGSLSRWINNTRKLNSATLERLERWLNSHERSTKNR